MLYSIGDVIYLKWRLLTDKNAQRLAGKTIRHRFIIYDYDCELDEYKVVCTTSNEDLLEDSKFILQKLDWESVTYGTFTTKTFAVLSTNGSVSERMIREKIGQITNSDLSIIISRMSDDLYTYQKIENINRRTSRLRLRIKETD